MKIKPITTRRIKTLLNRGAEVRALSWKEPYASMMLHGKIETRTWNTDYRGLVLMCASQKEYRKSDVLRISGYDTAQKIYELIQDEKNGLAYAIGRLIDSRRMKPEDSERAHVIYRKELWCHVYDSVHLIKPFTWLGTQGFKKLSSEEKLKIKFN